MFVVRNSFIVCLYEQERSLNLGEVSYDGMDWFPEPKSSHIFRINTQTLCSKVVISTARGLRDFPAIFAELLWDDSRA